MSNYGKVWQFPFRLTNAVNARYHQNTSASQLNSVVFKDKAHAGIGSRFFSLFPGLGYAAVYKVGNTEIIRCNRANGSRSFNVFTSTEDSLLFVTTWPSTTEMSSTGHLAR